MDDYFQGLLADIRCRGVTEAELEELDRATLERKLTLEDMYAALAAYATAHQQEILATVREMSQYGLPPSILRALRAAVASGSIATASIDAAHQDYLRGHAQDLVSCVRHGGRNSIPRSIQLCVKDTLELRIVSQEEVDSAECGYLTDMRNYFLDKARHGDVYSTNVATDLARAVELGVVTQAEVDDADVHYAVTNLEYLLGVIRAVGERNVSFTVRQPLEAAVRAGRIDRAIVVRANTEYEFSQTERERA